MISALSYFVLPTEQTEFEDRHLARMNKVALVFFLCNVPLFAAVAWWNQTGLLFALLLTSLTLFGSTLATMVWRTSRSTSVIHGITAMCMGGLLVHFGQGPMQIEMHFYFFSLLAVLAIFGNPMVIVAAAVTVTLHHTVIWAIIPDSVFNYEASIWVVAVHASFVVIESGAAVFLARSYFDNVIGLERIVAERTSELDAANQSMRLVLENVGEGLVTVDREGRLARERSAKAGEWLGTDATATPLADRVRSIDADAGEWLELGWQDLQDGIMPMAVTLDQLPKSIVRGEQQLKMTYIPIGETEDGDFERMLVVMSDVSAEMAAKEAEAQQRQLLALIQTFNDDRAGFQAFYEESSSLMALLADPAALKHDDVLRWLHTLKGNALSYKMDQFGQAIHGLETQLSEERRTMSIADFHEIDSHWNAIREGLGMIIGVQDDGYMRVSSERAAELERAVSDNRDSTEVLSILRSIAFQPTEVRLTSIAMQAERIASVVGLSSVHIIVEHNDVYVPPAAWAPFWSSLGHVVRNALDHGIESGEERLLAGKSEIGTLTLRSEAVDGFVTVSVTDDGRGINWEAIRSRALEAGLSVSHEADLVEALFFEGLTTCENATELSGRGVGMSAVRQACLDCGGTVDVTTSENEGTTISFQFPQPLLGAAVAA
jgi:signal transduction histidine kinase